MKPSFTTLNKQCIGPFQKCLPIIKKFKKKEHQEPRLKLYYTLLASVHCWRPPEAIVQD